MPFINNTFDLAELADVVNGILMGVAFAHAAIKTWSKIKPTYSAVHKISQAKTVAISDLRSLLSSASNASESESSKEMLVIVRGITETNSRNKLNLTPDVLVSATSDEKCVVLEQTFDNTKFEVLAKSTWGVGWPFKMTMPLEKNTSVRKIPFILSERGKHSDHVFVNFEGSSHSLPLERVFDLYGNPSYYTLGPQFLVEEKILSIGKEISVVGICSLHNGNLEIKACEELPCFLSELTKDELVQWHNKKGAMLVLCAFGLGTLSVLLLAGCLKMMCNFWRWKEEPDTRQDTPDVNIKDVDETSQDSQDKQ